MSRMHNPAYPQQGIAGMVAGGDAVAKAKEKAGTFAE